LHDDDDDDGRRKDINEERLRAWKALMWNGSKIEIERKGEIFAVASASLAVI
jgi:hypothetical protein